jgi:hypothetical protein
MHTTSRHLRTRLTALLSLFLLCFVAVLRPAMAAAPALRVTVNWTGGTTFTITVGDAPADMADYEWEEFCFPPGSTTEPCTEVSSRSGNLVYTLDEALPGRVYHVIIDRNDRGAPAYASITVEVNGVVVTNVFCECLDEEIYSGSVCQDTF